MGMLHISLTLTIHRRYKMETRYDYNESFGVYYKWQLIANVIFVGAIVAVSFIAASFGLTEETAVNTAVLSGVALMIWAYILGLKKMAYTWPTGEGKPFWWGGLKVTFLNFGLLGYRHTPVSQLPWKAVLTWGMASALLSPTIIQLAVAGLYSQLLQVVVTVIFLIPVIILAMWGIGKLLGAIFNRPQIAV
jgi:hypothetical protein